jgi:hypothetical protein
VAAEADLTNLALKRADLRRFKLSLQDRAAANLTDLTDSFLRFVYSILLPTGWRWVRQGCGVAGEVSQKESWKIEKGPAKVGWSSNAVQQIVAVVASAPSTLRGACHRGQATTPSLPP